MRDREEEKVMDGFTFVGQRAKRRRQIATVAMLCDLCGAQMVERIATATNPYRYDLSGLKNVALVNVAVRKCTNASCEGESVVIPQAATLHSIITECLLKKPLLLSGDEIRFLRKNAGIAAKELAAYLGTDAAHLSKVETGMRKNLGAPADKLVRAIIADRIHKEKAPTTTVLLNKTEMQAGKPLLEEFTLHNDRWNRKSA
jgi:DNA-binding transcriptional regulator YiaG